MKQYKNNKYLVLLLAITLLTSNVAYGREDEINDDSSSRKSVELRNSLDEDKENSDDNNEYGIYKEEARKLKAEYEAKLEALKVKINEQKDKAKVKKDELKLNNRKDLIDRWDNAVEKIKKSEDKLSEVILKAKTAGIDTTSAKASLKQASEKITAIEANAKLMMDIVVKPLPLSDVDKTKLKDLSTGTQKLVRETKALLQKTSKDLRSAIQAKRKIEKKEDSEKTNSSN